MISALSQATAHAGQRVKPTPTPTAQQQAATAPTDDPNALPPAPTQQQAATGTTNTLQPTPDNNNQTQVVLVKKESGWKKVSPFVAAGLVGLLVAAFGLHRSGKKFLKENVSEYANKLVKPESQYKKEYLDPLFNIAKALNEHEKANPNDKETVEALRNKLGIAQEKDGNLLVLSGHIIPFEGNKGDGVALSTVEHDEVQSLVAKLPSNIQDLVATFRTNLESVEVDSNSSANKVPSKGIILSFSRNEKGEIQFAPFDNSFRQNIYVGGQVIKHTVQGWLDKAMNRAEELEASKKQAR